MKELVKIEHRLIGDSDFVEIEFARGSHSFEQLSQPSSQGVVYAIDFNVSLKSVLASQVGRLSSPSVFRLTFYDQVVTLGTQDLPAVSTTDTDILTALKINYKSIKPLA